MNLSPDSFEMIEVGIKTIELTKSIFSLIFIYIGDYINFISTMNNKK